MIWGHSGGSDVIRRVRGREGDVTGTEVREREREREIAKCHGASFQGAEGATSQQRQVPLEARKERQGPDSPVKAPGEPALPTP